MTGSFAAAKVAAFCAFCAVWLLAAPAGNQGPGGWPLFPSCASAAAVELTSADLEKLDQASSRYKVVPEMADRVKALVLPFQLDGQVAQGFVLDGITLDRHRVGLVLKKGESLATVHLLPPEVSVDGGTKSRSFVIVTEGDPAVTGPVVEAIVRNDDGSFWPAAPKEEAASEQARRVAPSVRKVHFTELMGDFFVLMLLVALGAGAGALRRTFAGRSLGWWWGLVGVTALALGLRIAAFLVLPGGELNGVWVPADELPHVSAAWYLGTMARFTTVSLEGVAVLNVVLGALTAAGTFAVASLAMPGTLGPLAAGLVVATLPGHVAVSASISPMIPLVAFSVMTLLALVVHARTREWGAHWMAAALFLFTVFMRPEAPVLGLALLGVSFVAVPVREWRRPSFFVPTVVMLAVAGIRVGTLSSAPPFEGEFLAWSVDPAAPFANLLHWWLAPARIPLVVPVLVVLGLACRPWREDRALFVVSVLWLAVAAVVWFHVDMTGTYRGGRVSLALLPPLALLAGWGVEWILRLRHPRRGWLVALFVAWLVLAPAMHWGGLAVDYKAVFEGNFMLEV